MRLPLPDAGAGQSTPPPPVPSYDDPELPLETPRARPSLQPAVRSRLDGGRLPRVHLLDPALLEDTLEQVGQP